MSACISDESPLGVYNMVGSAAIPQGADWDVAIRYLVNGTPVDFSGCSAKMQIRKDYDKHIILELSSDNGTVELGDGSGITPNVILKFRASETSPLDDYFGIYDLEVTTLTGSIVKFIRGKFQLEPEITK